MTSSTSNKAHWLDIVETVSVVGSVSGSIASIFLKQFFWATIPLSASATFALINHQRLKSLIVEEKKAIAILIEKNQTSITRLETELQKQDRESKAGIAELEDELGQIKNLAITELARLDKEEKEDFNNAAKQLQELQISFTQLDSLSRQLEQNLNSVDNKQKETAKLVRELKAIDIFTQNIKADINTVQSYFERGFAYQRLGNKHRAIDDYSKTIELEKNHAQAYHNRGMLYAELGIDQKAVIDLRRASQLYFDKGNLDKYRETRDLSQKVHQNNTTKADATVENEVSEKIVIGNLFN